MFTLQSLDPAAYRNQTRTSSLILIVVFAALGMGLSSLLVLIWGNPGGNNFKLNLSGVLLGLGTTLLLVKVVFSKQPFMQAAVYSWQLKRNLMRITNKMHLIKQQARVNQPEAVQLLNFYYLALTQMHQLEGNDAAILELKVEQQAVQQQMQDLGLDQYSNYLNPDWLEKLDP